MIWKHRRKQHVVAHYPIVQLCFCRYCMLFLWFWVQDFIHVTTKTGHNGIHPRYVAHIMYIKVDMCACTWCIQTMLTNRYLFLPLPCLFWYPSVSLTRAPKESPVAWTMAFNTVIWLWGLRPLPTNLSSRNKTVSWNHPCMNCWANSSCGPRIQVTNSGEVNFPSPSWHVMWNLRLKKAFKRDMTSMWCLCIKTCIRHN